MPTPSPVHRRRSGLSWWLTLAGLAVGGGVGMTLMQADLQGLAWGRTSPRAPDLSALPFFDPATDPATDRAPQAAPTGPAHPEARLMQVLDLLERQELDAARLASRQLVRAHPDFMLAQFVEAQLESLRAPGPIGEAPVPPADEASARILQDLLAEARQRRAAHRQPPPPGSLPTALIEVAPRTRHVLVVDTGESRLHVFENGEQGLRRVDDMYVTVGRRGVGKTEEGDQKTPIGIYHTGVLRHYQPADPRLGTHGYTLNFPNALDRLAGRSGTAILLHGVSPDTYSRPPQDSDGCLSLTNQDLQRLVARGLAPDTPVVIARRLDWREPAAIARPAAMDAAWRDWLARSRPPGGRIEDVSMLGWQEQGVVVVSFSAIDGERRRRLRQYWGEGDGGWQVLAEGEVR
jgi:L,D-transpeptidase YnhG